MKKLISLLIAGLMSMSLVACGSTQNTSNDNSKANEKSNKVTIWCWDPNFNIAAMKEAKDIYKKTNPDVNIEIVEMAKADVEQKLSTNLVSKSTEGLPDIVLIEDYNAQKYLQAYPGSFVDLTGKINIDDFANYKTKLLTLDNKLYGVPFDSGVAGFFYRTDYLEKAGFTADDLKNITWDRFIEIGKEVKKKTGKAMLALNPNDGGLIRIMLQSAGQWYYDKDGNIDLINNDVMKESVETVKKIMDADIIKPSSGWDDWVASFNKGDAASIISGVWVIGSIKPETSQSGKWAVAPVPRLNNSNSVNASNLGGSSWYVLNGSKGQDAAIEFLKTIYDGNNDFYQAILKDIGAVGTYLPAQNGGAYSVEDEYFGGQKVYEELSQYMKNIPAVNYGIYTYEADASIMAVMPDITSGKMSVEDALKVAQDELKNKIQQ